MVQWKRVQLGTMGPHSVGWGSGVAMSCGVGHTRGAGLTLLWLCCRLAAVALTGPLAWEPLYAVGAALKRQKKKKKSLPSHWVNRNIQKADSFYPEGAES